MKERVSWTSVMGALVTMSAGAAHAEYHSASATRLRFVAVDTPGGVPLGPSPISIPRTLRLVWPLDLRLTFSRPARAGNLLVLFFELGDERALAAHETIAIYQGPARACRSLRAQLELSRSDGFEPAHSYGVRVVQLCDGDHVQLAEGVIRLL